VAGLNDRDGLRAFDRREAFQKIFNGFAAFQGINQVLQGNPGAGKHGRATHDFGVRVNNAFQTFHCHNITIIPPTPKLSPANRVRDMMFVVIASGRFWGILFARLYQWTPQ